MICLILIMTMIFINSTESAEQKIRHSDTLLKEEDMNAKTKAWLLMVESGKVDEEELRRITPKSIFIAPLLTSRTGKCKEGYRHDHLGQCVKVIKIDPQVQLELLLQKLNKLYGEKKEDKKEEETEEIPEKSSGPLHFSLPISNIDEKASQTISHVKSEAHLVSSTTANTTASEEPNAPEFIPLPLPMVHLNQTNQTKEIELSGAEPLNEGEPKEISQFEGSGDEQSASGDGLHEEGSTTPFQVGFLSEETDYIDATEAEPTFTEVQSTTESTTDDYTTTQAAVKEVLLTESYRNITNVPSVNNSATILPKEVILKNKSNAERIYFPIDDEDDSLRTPGKPSVYNSRIRFPDEIPQQQAPSYLPPPDTSTKSSKYQIHSSAIPREQFWWLPKNWEVDENQKNSPLVKVWSRLPLIHDITYSRESPDGFKKSPLVEPPPQISPQYRNEGFSIHPSQQQMTTRILKPFKSSRFQDILLTPRQSFRFQR